MANTVSASRSQVPTASAETGALGRLLLPSFSDCLFLAVLFWLFASGSGGWTGLLADGDTGWHIRTGDWILANHTVPHTDLFSFSKPASPWYAWEWLSDVIFSLLHSAMGLKGIVLLAALLIAGFGTLLFRHLLWCGVTPFAALLVSLLVHGASFIHYLARPHVFTLFAFAVSMFVLHADRLRPGRRIWWLVALLPVWVNLHGGFLALIAMLGLLTAGTALEQFWTAQSQGSAVEWQSTRRYAAITAVAVLMTFVNPYGWHLHEHMASFLQSDWIKANIQEFQSPVFRGESAMQYELMLFAGLATTAWLISRRQVVPALWILFWAHQSLASVRHVPLYMIAAAPYVGLGLTELWNRYIETGGKKTTRGIFASLANDIRPGCARTSAWIALVALALPLLPEGTVKWPADFPAVMFPSAMVAKHKDALAGARVLTMDRWADYLIYKSYPRQKVFVDGRSDFYGPELGEEYIRITQGKFDWRPRLEKHNFGYVLSPLNWPLTSLLKNEPGWRVVDDDSSVVLFERMAYEAR